MSQAVSTSGSLLSVIVNPGSGSPAECGVTYIESLDLDNPAVLRALDSGSYVLYGKFKAYSGDNTIIVFESKLNANIVKSTDCSSIMIFNPVNSKVECLTIYDDHYERTDVALQDVVAHIGQLKDDLDSFTSIERSPNLFDKNDENITNNAEIRSNGEVTVNAGWRTAVTDFIEINATESRTLRQTRATNIRIGEYKSDGTFIGITSITSSSPMTLNDETEKIRIEFNGSSGLMVYQSDTELPYEDYYVNTLVKENAIPTTIARKNDVEIELALLDDRVSSLEEYEMTNYMLFVDVYVNKKYENGAVTDYEFGNATSMTKLDKNYSMYAPNAVGEAVFFDVDKNYIESIELKYGTPILTSQYPTNAEYVAFWYMRQYMTAKTMYVIRTNNKGLRTRKFGTTIKKKAGERPVVNIYSNDSETDILLKLADAMLTGDCDVYFEHGTYTFNEVFVTMYEVYDYREYCELPIGGNCRYYFNGSTLIGKGEAIKEKNYSVTIDLLSCIESTLAQNFELHDGTLIGNGINYVVHDESGTKDGWYIHRYHNVKMQSITGISTSNYRRCIGGGTGLHGEVIIENCTFYTDWNTRDAGFHGNYNSNSDADFVVRVANCYFENEFEIGNLGTNQTAHLDYCGNSSKKTPTSNSQIGTKGSWSVRSWCNEVHS